MKKINLFTIFAIVACILISFTTRIEAADSIDNFVITANVPSADTATFGVSRVYPLTAATTDDVFIPLGDIRPLTFGTLGLNTDGVFAPVNTTDVNPDGGGASLDDEPYFYVIDIGSNGAGNPDFQFAHIAGVGVTDIGDNVVVTFAKVVSDPGGDIVTGIGGFDPDSLTNVPASMDEGLVAGGFLRVGVGLSTGAAGEGDAEPLTAASPSGDHGATLRITTTFD